MWVDLPLANYHFLPFCLVGPNYFRGDLSIFLAPSAGTRYNKNMSNTSNVSGTYSFDGTTYTMELVHCLASDTFRYQVEIVEGHYCRRVWVDTDGSLDAAGLRGIAGWTGNRMAYVASLAARRAVQYALAA